MLVVAPYKGLLELVTTLLPRYSDRMEIESVVGNLEEGLKRSKNAVAQGVDVIISRGGTTQMLRNAVSIPVIDVEVSGYDYLRAIKMASGYSGKSALVGFPRITSGASRINELLHAELNIVTIHSSQEVVPAMEKLRREGYSLILGDMIAVRIAREMGFNVMLLTSGEESVSNALQNAVYMYECTHGYRSQTQLLEQLMGHTSQTVLAVDAAGAVLYQNAEVEGLGLKRQDILCYLRPVLERGEQEAVLQGSQGYVQLRGRVLSLPQGDAAVFYCTPMSTARRCPVKGVSFRHIGDGAAAGFDIFSGNTRYAKAAVEFARSCCSSDRTVLLQGEAGVGKAALAESIHRGSARNKGPLTRLDCDLMGSKEWSEFFALWEELAPSLRKGTVCLCEVDCLSALDQKFLLSQLDSGALDGCRLIATATKSVRSLVCSGAFLPRLYDALAESEFYLPSLGERMDELKDIASLFMMAANTKYGKQVVGFTQEVLERMQHMPWKGNYDQLKTVVNQMVLGATQTFLGVGDLSRALSQPENEPYACVPLEGTLEEITQKVIERVLKEEGGNASTAAKRLGIGRSTLWRRMKPKQEHMQKSSE